VSGYLLDTNVVSEVMRSAPDVGVVAFLSEHENLWLSSIVIHELEYGLQLMAQGQRRAELRAALQEFIAEYEDRILHPDRSGAEWAARFRAQARRTGRTLDLGDALVAGIAKTNDLAIATRNVRDFDELDLTVVDPWEKSRS